MAIILYWKYLHIVRRNYIYGIKSIWLEWKKKQISLGNIHFPLSFFPVREYLAHFKAGKSSREERKFEIYSVDTISKYTEGSERAWKAHWMNKLINGGREEVRQGRASFSKEIKKCQIIKRWQQKEDKGAYTSSILAKDKVKGIYCSQVKSKTLKNWHASMLF